MKFASKLRSVAACGLGCALVMALSPAAAFAVSGTTADDGTTSIETLEADSEAATEVRVFGTDSQISVTVPVGLTVAASGAPGAKFAGSPTNYKIVNDSYFDVQVKSVKAEASESWDYSDAAVTKTSTVTDGKVGAIHIDLFPGNAKDAPSLSTGGVPITTAGVDTSTGSNAAKWKIAAKTTATPTELAIGINGTTKLDQNLSEDSTAAAAAATLTYTIGRA